MDAQAPSDMSSVWVDFDWQVSSDYENRILNYNFIRLWKIFIYL